MTTANMTRIQRIAALYEQIASAETEWDHYLACDEQAGLVDHLKSEYLSPEEISALEQALNMSWIW